MHVKEGGGQWDRVVLLPPLLLLLTIHPSIYQYIHPSMHPSIHPYMHILHQNMHTYIRISIYLLTRSCLVSSTQSIPLHSPLHWSPSSAVPSKMTSNWPWYKCDEGDTDRCDGDDSDSNTIDDRIISYNITSHITWYNIS